MRKFWVMICGAMAAMALVISASAAMAQESIFAAQDANGDGSISQREYALFETYLFLSLDYDSDDKISTEEWNSWDPSTIGVVFAGRQTGLVYSALGSLFVSLDTGVDGFLSEQELTNGLFHEFAASDQDQNGFLNKEEFDQAFVFPKELETTVAEMTQPPA